MTQEVHTLYVNPNKAELDSYQLASIVAKEISGHSKLNTAYDDFSIFEIFKNEIFDEQAVRDHDFTRSRFRMNASARTDAPINSADIFIEILCHLIISLRSRQFFVVIAGELEEFIAEKTGWNWTEDNQIQPNTKIGRLDGDS